jgi:protein-S-isoprenylcysteine O-methyltransferase Ste14
VLNLKIKIGNLLFKHRSFTPLPFIVLVFVIFSPVNLGEKNFIIDVAGLFISFLGELIRIVAVGYSFPGTSGRETYLRADKLNCTGIYSITRNPLYIGNFLIFAGLVTVFANVYAVLLFSAFLISQYYFIIHSEEQYLKGKYGKEYEEFCTRVRRLIPTFKKYRKNKNPFSGMKVLFKEKSSVFNLLLMYLLILLYKEYKFEEQIRQPLGYIIAGCVLVAAYFIVKFMGKVWNRREQKKRNNK